MIDRATAWIEAETGRKFKARDYGGTGTHGTTGTTAEGYIYFDGTTKNKGGGTIVSVRGLGEFYLPQWPVQNGSANALDFELGVLNTRGSDVPSNEEFLTDELVEWDDYVVDYEQGIVRLLAGQFTPGTRNYRIKCTAGFQVGAAQPYVPDDLEGLCVELATQVYKGSRNLQSESIGTWSRTFSSAKEDRYVQSILDKYTRYAL